MPGEEGLETFALLRIESVAARTQEAQPGAVPAERGHELAGHAQEVQRDDPHGVEAVGDDHRPREPAPDHEPIRVGQIDADHAHLLATAQTAQVARQLTLAPASAYVEDPAVLKIAEGRREALSSVERMLVDPEDERTVDAQPLPSLPLGKLRVDAPHRGRAHVLAPRERRGADPIVVALIEDLAVRLCAPAPRQDTGQPLHKTLATS